MSVPPGSSAENQSAEHIILRRTRTAAILMHLIVGFEQPSPLSERSERENSFLKVSASNNREGNPASSKVIPIFASAPMLTT